MRVRNITIIGVLAVLIVVAVYFGGFFSVVFEGTVQGAQYEQVASCGVTTTRIVDNMRFVYTTTSYPYRDYEADPVWKNEYNTICIPTDYKIFVDDVLLFHHTNSLLVNRLQEYDPSVIISIQQSQIHPYPNGQTYTFAYPKSIAIDFQVEEGNERGLIYTRVDNRGWSSTGNTQGARHFVRFQRDFADINSEIITQPLDMLNNKKISFEVTSNVIQDISYSNICVRYGVKGFFGITQEQEQCHGQQGVLVNGQKKTFTFDIPDTDVREYQATIVVKDARLILSSWTTSGLTWTTYTRQQFVGNNYKLGDFKTEPVNVSYASVLLGDIEQQLSYIESLELTSLELANLINSLELSVDEQIFLLRELELTLEEQGQLINNLNLEVNEQAQIINGLQLNIEQQAVLIGTLNLKVQEQAQLISQLELNIEQQGQIINSLNLEISQQAILINQLTTSLTEKARLVDLLHVENEEQAELINQMRLSFNDQSEIINLLNYQVEEDAVIIANLQLSLTEKALLIESLRYTIDEKIIIINQLTQNVNEQAVIISNLQTTVEEKIVMIANLTQNLEEQAIIISSLKENVEQKARIIEGLQRTVDEQAVLINKLRTTLEEKERIIDELRISLAQKDEMKENLESGTNLTLIGGITLLVVFLIFLYQMWKGRKK